MVFLRGHGHGHGHGADDNDAVAFDLYVCRCSFKGSPKVMFAVGSAKICYLDTLPELH